MAVTPTAHRRSQRLFLQVPVIVHWHLPGRPGLSETTKTIVLNAHGALVELSATLEHGQNVTLQNAKTNEMEESVVKLVSPGESGKFNVAIEFVKPNPNFWHISFPPEDWTLRHSQAKRTR